MSETPEVYVYPDGSEAWALEGGGWVTFDPDGTPSGAVDGDGQELDASGVEYPAELAEELARGEYAEEDDEEYFEGDDGELGELGERMDALEQLASQPREVEPLAYELPEHADERWAERFRREAEHFAAELGREPTEREWAQIMESHYADHAAGLEPNIWQAATTADIIDASDHEGRSRLITERLQDDERDAEGRDISDPVGPRSESYDMGRSEDRTAAILDRMDGHSLEGRTYHGDDPQPEPDYSDEEDW